MELVTPEIGLVFWTTVSFLILFLLLSKFAWKPILSALNERERSIENALSRAEMAKEEAAKLTLENDAVVKQARLERDGILKEAKELKDQIINDAKIQAQAEGVKLIEKANIEINNQKIAAMEEVKDQVSSLALEIAEKVLRQRFEDRNKQEALVSGLLNEVKLN